MKMHSHQINVQTPEEVVTVTIGSDGGIPGGFAKLFNRVVDSGAWGGLSDAARAAYLPMVRFADQRNQFRVQIGQASLMKYAGLSRSSIKRAMKDLLASRLIALVERGGVTELGENECSVYQLMVPAERRSALRAPQAEPHPSPRPAAESFAPPALPPASLSATPPPTARRAAPVLAPATPPGPSMTPLGVHPRTPGRIADGRPQGSPLNRTPGPRRTPAGGQDAGPWGSGGGPQFRMGNKDHSSKNGNPDAPPAHPRLTGRAEEFAGEAAPPPADLAAALLRENGVEAPADRALAEAYPYARIVDVVAAMQYRRSRGACDNPGGFIRQALLKQWQTPKAVLDARARAEIKLKQDEADRAARGARQGETDREREEERRVERAIAALDEEEMEILAESVAAKYADNPAVLRVLTRRPPRECRLMRMEIAAMLETARG